MTTIPRRGDESSYMPTTDEIRAETEAIKAEAFAGARGRIRNYGVKLMPRSPRIFRDPRRWTHVS